MINKCVVNISMADVPTSNPRFELLRTSDIEVSKGKRPTASSDKSKIGLASLIAILTVSLCIVFTSIIVFSSSSKVSEINVKLAEVSSQYESNKVKSNQFKAQLDKQKGKNQELMSSISKLNDDVGNIRRETENLSTKENELKQKLDDYTKISEGADQVLIKDLEMIKLMLSWSQYFNTDKFNVISKENVLSIRDSVILTSQNEIDFLEKISKGKIRSLCYSSKRDGLNGEVFIQKCFNLTPTLVLVYIKTGAKFGGYTSKTWEKNHIKEDAEAFMFNLNDEVLFPINKHQWAMSTGYRGLPQFGYGDLKLMEDGTGRSSFPSTYGDLNNDGLNKLTKGVTNIKSYMLEVFVLNPM